MKPSFVLRFGITELALWLTACATNPVTGNPNFVVMSESQEISTGRSADAEVRKQYYVYDVQELQDYVNQVGQKLARNSHRPNLSYHFTVLESTEINAFALSGGYIPDVNYPKPARTSSLGKNSEGYLRLLNAQYPSGEPARGQALKIVE